MMAGWRSVWCDWLVLAALAVAQVCVLVAGPHLPVTRRGFFCDDPSIRYPFRESIVPSWAMVLVTVAVPGAVVIAGDVLGHWVHNWRCRRKQEEGQGEEEAPRPRPHRHCLWTTARHLTWYAIGYLINSQLNLICKPVVGGLRPTFISVCQPDFSAFNCTGEDGFPVYVTDYVCLNNKTNAVRDVRFSWFSGHTSYSCYAFIFLALYILLFPLALPVLSRAVRLLCASVSLLFALLISLSRIVDNHHHPFDMVCGFAVGLGLACWVALYELKCFKEHCPLPQEPAVWRRPLPHASAKDEEQSPLTKLNSNGK